MVQKFTWWSLVFDGRDGNKTNGIMEIVLRMNKKKKITTNKRFEHNFTLNIGILPKQQFVKFKNSATMSRELVPKKKCVWIFFLSPSKLFIYDQIFFYSFELKTVPWIVIASAVGRLLLYQCYMYISVVQYCILYV